MSVTVIKYLPNQPGEESVYCILQVTVLHQCSSRNMEGGEEVNMKEQCLLAHSILLFNWLLFMSQD